MDIIARFEISAHQNIEIQVPRFQEKYNVCYETTPELNEYDLVKVAMHNNADLYAISDDYLKAIIEDFKENLVLLLNDELRLNSSLEVGKVGYAYNHAIYHEKDKEHDICFGYSIWPTSRGRKTFLYSNSNTLYLEISRLYRWLYEDPQEGQEFVPFEEYMKTYQPLAVLEIERTQAQAWLNQCEELQKSFDEPVKK